MPSYRLLRSNKESGPYSLNDLVTLGLKPYDLVWVEGRSAAWRYPSEVAELKDYAPITEEQPYDRFYKKSSETQPVARESITPSREEPAPQKVTVIENVIKEEPVNKPVNKIITEIPSSSQSNVDRPKKQVFVSMPERNNGFDHFQHEEYQQYLPKQKPVQEKPIPAEQKSYSPINIQESQETRVETKYTQSLDDIKEMYINTLVQRKSKNRKKEIFRKYVKPALIPLFLVISGMAIGYVITYRKNTPQVSQSVSTVIPQQNTPPQNNEVTPADNKIPRPRENQDLALETKNKNRQVLNPQQGLSIQSQKLNKNTRAVPKAVVNEKNQKQVFAPDDDVAFVQKRNVQVNPATGERTRAVRDNDEVGTRENNLARNTPEHLNKKNNSERLFIETDRKNIRDFVSVKSNNYTRGAFGGIRGLELTVYNTSDFLLDEVSVELQIMKPSEQPLRTDIITVRNIAPNGAVIIRVPDSQRGIRADYRITNIESKQWQKSTAGL